MYFLLEPSTSSEVPDTLRQCSSGSAALPSDPPLPVPNGFVCHPPDSEAHERFWAQLNPEDVEDVRHFIADKRLRDQQQQREEQGLEVEGVVGAFCLTCGRGYE